MKWLREFLRHYCYICCERLTLSSTFHSLHGCFGITASNDLELIPFVKILEDEMDRRPSKNSACSA